MRTCPVCSGLINPTRHYELRAVITKVGDEGIGDHVSEAGGEIVCTARCALVRLSRLVDDASGAHVHTELRLTDAARERVRRATVQRPGRRIVA